MDHTVAAAARRTGNEGRAGEVISGSMQRSMKEDEKEEGEEEEEEEEDRVAWPLKRDWGGMAGQASHTVHMIAPPTQLLITH
uniref:Uncharacterized protein n=1 Tax=Oryza brachyantha TaxID=4533 RepID=J3LIF1_ORYBR